MNFAKKLFLSSVFAVGAFGLVACGSDSKSSTEPGPDEPGGKIEIPTQKDANITVSSDIGSRISGDDVRFAGRFGFELVVDTLENSDDIAFTNIEYKVAKGSDASNLTMVPAVITSNTIVFPTENSIDLNSMNSAFVSVSLLDPAFTECGTYSLIVTVTANNGAKDFQRTEIIPFERAADYYCQVIDTTTQEQPKAEVAMTACQVELSTNINPGLSLATCTAVPAASAATADIIFAKAGSKSNPEMTATSGTGLMFAPINNGDLPPYTDDYEVDMWPEDMNTRTPPTAYVSDFKFKSTGTGATIASMIENSNQIYVALAPGYNAETGVGFYAFAITEATEGNNGDYTFKVKLYKVQ